MIRLIIQLKTIIKDKMSILSFILPIIIAVFLSFYNAKDIDIATEVHFAVIDVDIETRVLEELENMGIASIYSSYEELKMRINDPSDEVIGVISDGKQISVLLSGDESSFTVDIANNLGKMLRRPAFDANKIERKSVFKEFKNLIYAVVILMALFIGCTFNAMNIVNEKENGVDNINKILPSTFTSYFKQKTLLGFITSIMVSTITVAFFIENFDKIHLLLLMIILSSFITSIFGLMIGVFSDSIISAISYIKILLTSLMAIPIIIYVFAKDTMLCTFAHIVPSYPVFLGFIHYLNKDYRKLILEIIVLALHCVLVLYLNLIINKIKLNSESI